MRNSTRTAYAIAVNALRISLHERFLNILYLPLNEVDAVLKFVRRGGPEPVEDFFGSWTGNPMIHPRMAFGGDSCDRTIDAIGQDVRGHCIKEASSLGVSLADFGVELSGEFSDLLSDPDSVVGEFFRSIPSGESDFHSERCAA